MTGPEMIETQLDVRDLKLEPLLVKGDLVPDRWWEASPPKTTSFFSKHWLFISLVVVPIALAIIYYGLIASRQYYSEAQFLVRTSSQNDVGNLGSFLQNQKMSRANDETYAIAEYLVSREAVHTLIGNDHLRDMLSRPAADFFSRYPNFYSRQTDEALYRHFLNFVSVEVSTESGIATLEVRAFTPEDAQNLASAMMKNAEKRVNDLNVRYYEDSLQMANKFLSEAKSAIVDVENRLTVYRNSEKVLDPSKESAAALLGIGQMSTMLMQSETELTEQMAMAPSSPQVQPLREKVASIREEIAKERAKLAGSDSSMASKLSQFEELTLERELDARGLAAAAAHLITARENAERQQFYLETAVKPDLPDQALYPKRGRSILFVAAACLCLFWIVRTLLKNIQEHQV
jgi:capsular polysaccharide transport system permease protein